jgi:hypothetical protein
MIAHRNESAFLLPCLLSEQRRLARTEKTAYERYGQLAIASYSRHRHVASIGTGVGDSRLFVSSPLGARSVSRHGVTIIIDCELKKMIKNDWKKASVSNEMNSLE